MPKKKTLSQCPSCPWRVDCVPDRDIPNYKRGLHEDLDHTIAKPGDTANMFCGTMRMMACHYSKPKAEFPCAGWMHHQLGVGNNIALRLRMLSGKLPIPKVDGPQHERFEDTLCNSTCAPKPRRQKRSKGARR